MVTFFEALAWLLAIAALALLVVSCFMFFYLSWTFSRFVKSRLPNEWLVGIRDGTEGGFFLSEKGEQRALASESPFKIQIAELSAKVEFWRRMFGFSFVTAVVSMTFVGWLGA